MTEFRRKADQISKGTREGENLNQRLVNKYFVPSDLQWRQNSSVNQLGSKEWECGESVSGLVIHKEEGPP